jgi:hypothetical protein
MKSTFLTLNVKDLINGLIVTVLAAVLTIVQTTVDAGSLSFDWPFIAKAALTAAISYLIKNFLTNSGGTFFKKEAK